jgi:DNA sulfur modification protein DndB
MLGKLTDSAQARVAEFKARKTRFDQRTFRKDEADYAKSEGWELVRENVATLRFQKLRSPDLQLENEAWILLYQFGYPALNVGRDFTIEVASDRSTTVAKQIDVFAYDDETVIVCECKASDVRTKRSLQKDLGEFAGNQKAISNALRRHFGGTLTQKVIWLFVTRNIEWSAPDRARAKELNIDVITEREFSYYREVGKRLGPSARFQFQAEFLEGTKVAALQRKVHALRTKLGRTKAYTFFAPASAILPISFVNHRDLRDPEAAPSYQRLVHRARLKEIAGFLQRGGFFPNAVILNFKKRVTFDPLRAEDEYSITPGLLTLPNTYKSAWVIDGQHRLFGYAELEDLSEAEHLPVLAFEDLPLGDESKMFADINSKQKSVPKKLLDEIAGEIKLESANRKEQLRAIGSRTLDLMRDDDEGPLGDKISGAEIQRSDQSIITIPYLTDAILQSGLLGRVVNKGSESAFFQGPLYWDDPKSGIDALYEALTTYLDLLRRANEARWASGRPGKFATNVGVAALVRLLADLIAYFQDKEKEDPRQLHPRVLVERVAKNLAPVLEYFSTAADEELSQRFAVPFGAGGIPLFQHRLRELVKARVAAFDPVGFARDLRKYDSARRQIADEQVREIVQAVHGHVVETLRAHYPGADDFLEIAVENKEILKKAYEKRLDDAAEDKKDLATYLDFVDLRKIVERPKNWELFRATLNIRLPQDGENKNAKCVSWFDEINKLRRISAHPYNRFYDDDQVSQVALIHRALAGVGVLKSDLD